MVGLVTNAEDISINGCDEADLGSAGEQPDRISCSRLVWSGDD